MAEDGFAVAVEGTWQPADTTALLYLFTGGSEEAEVEEILPHTVGHATAGEQLGHRRAFMKRSYDALTVPVPLL